MRETRTQMQLSVSRGGPSTGAVLVFGTGRTIAARVFSLREANLFMKAEPARATQNREQMERDTLRLLCSVLVKPGTRLEICRLLHARDFLDALRRTVFEEILAAGLMESKHLRAALPSRMKNRGYADFDLDRLLAPKLANEAEIERLFESTLCLLKLSGSNEPMLFASEADDQD